jgi:VanZ like family
MRNQTPRQDVGTCAASWSIRILSLSLIGILFLTFFPFRFSFQAIRYAGSSPFLLGGSGKDAGVYNSFLNILLFIPFGFGLSERFRERGKSRTATLFLCLVVGALLSYTIEFLQLFIPTRDSGWEDVATNASGSLFGCLLFVLFEVPWLRLLGRAEATVRSSLTRARAVLLISIYFAVWLAISISLQMETRLGDWNPESLLVVGNDAAGKFPTSWKGEVFDLEIWDHALPRKTAQALSAGGMSETSEASPQSAYDFLAPPFEDRFRFLPPLAWTLRAMPQSGSKSIRLDGTSWLVSDAPVANLVADIRRKNQFAIRVVCTPSEGAGSDGRIISISRRTGPVDLQIRQDNSNLVLWFRNALSTKRALLAWYVPNIFTANQRRDILFSYDGSVVSLYIDGSRRPRQYRLGPGTGLAHLFRRVKPSELDGYNDVYYFLVFFPGGALWGIAGQPMRIRGIAGFIFAALALSLPPVLLACALILSSGRSASLRDIAFSVILSAAGWLWINADSRTPLESRF